MNRQVVAVLDEAGAALGRESAALRDQEPDAAGRDPAFHAGPDHRRAREARADRGVRRPRQEQINLADGRAAVVHQQFRRREAGRDQQGAGRGRRDHRGGRRDGRRHPQDRRGDPAPGGEQAVTLKVAEKAVEAYAQLAQKNNTMIVPGNMSEVSALIATAMALMKPAHPK